MTDGERGYPLTDQDTAVLALSEMNITGNVIPDLWYVNLRRGEGRKSKPYTIAITLLADIVYWYRPIEPRDTRTGIFSGFRKKYMRQYLQKTYKSLCIKYGYGKDQVRDALKWLEKRGVIKLHFETILVGGRDFNNVMFIELLTDALKAITYPQHGAQMTLPHWEDAPKVSVVEPPYGENSPEAMPICSPKEPPYGENSPQTPGNFPGVRCLNSPDITENTTQNTTQTTQRAGAFAPAQPEPAQEKKPGRTRKASAANPPKAKDAAKDAPADPKIDPLFEALVRVAKYDRQSVINDHSKGGPRGRVNKAHAQIRGMSPGTSLDELAKTVLIVPAYHKFKYAWMYVPPRKGMPGGFSPTYVVQIWAEVIHWINETGKASDNGDNRGTSDTGRGTDHGQTRGNVETDQNIIDQVNAKQAEIRARLAHPG